MMAKGTIECATTLQEESCGLLCRELHFGCNACLIPFQYSGALSGELPHRLLILVQSLTVCQTPAAGFSAHAITIFTVGAAMVLLFLRRRLSLRRINADSYVLHSDRLLNLSILRRWLRRSNFLRHHLICSTRLPFVILLEHGLQRPANRDDDQLPDRGEKPTDDAEEPLLSVESPRFEGFVLARSTTNSCNLHKQDLDNQAANPDHAEHQVVLYAAENVVLMV
mmetsp:Transcript_43460/g.102387  ORF Transcript_43460/g.102387 Transcript_43460/m.102387 type:complete len:224 (-) Transcript_43460:2999-3670(-)